MRIALVHYHLQCGGVTRVIWHLLNALRNLEVQVVALTGRRPEGELPGSYRVIPGLQYEADRPAIDPAELARQMRQAATAALGGPPDLWHVHNHSLGKSLVLPGALRQLCHQGDRLLLHIHDFAEDGRPGNYRRMLAALAGGDPVALAALLYPDGGHVHYGVLNTRDHGFLGDAGLDQANLHLLPNPVDLGLHCEEEPVSDPDPSPLWLYPTRAIRRKNLGELLLWSALAPAGDRFATTSGPENPLERTRYQRWRQVAAELGLPVDFELIARPGARFVDLIREADGVVTTSVAEGFGMAFLEPWLLGRPVCGRDLPEITAEFRQEGLALPWVYDRLEVPIAWIGRDRLLAAARHGLEQTMTAYGRSVGRDDCERLLASWVRGDRVDFGRLDEGMQETVLRRLAQSPGAGRDLCPSAMPVPRNAVGTVQANCRLLRSRFSLAAYGTRVLAVYRRIVASPVTPVEGLGSTVLLDHFLAPERISLLRVD